MKYTSKELLEDLNNDTNWNVIRQKAVSTGFELKGLSKTEAEVVRIALNEYFKRKASKEHLDNPDIHYEIPHFCKPNS